jgi:hypothetical protein
VELLNAKAVLSAKPGKTRHRPLLYCAVPQGLYPHCSIQEFKNDPVQLPKHRRFSNGDCHVFCFSTTFHQQDGVGGNMHFRIPVLITTMTLFTALAIPVQSAAQDNQDNKEATFITFDAPGAGTFWYGAQLSACSQWHHHHLRCSGRGGNLRLQHQQGGGDQRGYFDASGVTTHGFLLIPGREKH